MDKDIRDHSRIEEDADGSVKIITDLRQAQEPIMELADMVRFMQQMGDRWTSECRIIGVVPMTEYLNEKQKGNDLMADDEAMRDFLEKRPKLKTHQIRPTGNTGIIIK